MGFVVLIELEEGILMHIPDGYLSPATTVPALAAMVPIWGVALNRLKRAADRRRVPLLALCAAFAFVIMLFNIPVVGGSSAHAVGAVLIAILMGPWAACIAVSTALLIQALVFGDGGLLAFGINCLNMAVIMPFAGYAVYKLFAGKASGGSRRGAVASFLGGYVGINLAALCAAVELGVQPLLFKAADGAPLYCPYPLTTTVPMMLFAHGLFAGPLEGVLTAAALALIAKYSPDLLPQNAIPDHITGRQPFFRRYKKPLIALCVLAVLSPLGLLARGTASFEWGAAELRSQFGYIPKGFAQLAGWWKAILPNYSVPAAGGAPAAGYILSAVVGVALIASVLFGTSKLMLRYKKADKP